MKSAPIHFQILMFWVTDNILMFKKSKQAETSLLDRVRIRYQLLRKSGKGKTYETDILLSDDDEMLLDCSPTAKSKPSHVV